ncbi:MAG: hypothetical protein CXX75_01000 [Methanobacteriota archaeon]|nr:MAG: hypothetical protein CXX75_01000 [Euryarchaeota archaeon]
MGGGLFARILMGILGLLLGLLMIAATLYRILAEFGRIDSSDIPDDIVNSLQILQALYYLVAAFCLAVIVLLDCDLHQLCVGAEGAPW